MKATLNVDYNEHYKKGDPVEGALAKRLVRSRLATEETPRRAPAPVKKAAPKKRKAAKPKAPPAAKVTIDAVSEVERIERDIADNAAEQTEA